MRLLKKILLSVLFIILILTSISCSQKDKNQENENFSLSIYLMDYDVNIKNAVYEFNKNNKDIGIKQTEFTSDRYADYQEKLKSGLVSGNEPDIVYFKALDISELSKFMEKGSFYDLNSLMGKDKSFKLSDYNQKVMDCGIYKGQRYIIPLSYSFDAFASTNQIIDSNKIDIKESGIGLDDMKKEGTRYSGSDMGEPKYFFSYLDFASIIQNTKTSFINMENKKAAFNSPEFTGLLEKYKEIYKYNYPEEKFNSIGSISNTIGLLKNDQAAIVYILMQGPKRININFSNAVSGMDIKVYPQLSPDSDGCIMARPEEFIAISSHCRNPEKAFEFIKILLSDKYQSNQLTGGIPVNTNAYEDEKKEYYGTNIAVQDMINRLDEMIGNMVPCKLMDEEVIEIINVEMKDFLSGAKTAVETANTIQKKVNTYLNILLEVDKNEQADTQEQPDKSTQSVNTGKKSTSQLSIYYLSNQFYMPNAIYTFSDKYPDFEIVENQFPFSSLDEFKDKLTTNLMSGIGPDIIAFDGRYFNSLYKVIQNSTFCDLNEFIDSDSTYKKTDYNNEMLNWGIFGGKRYFIPLSGQMDELTTAKKVLQQNNISIDTSNWTLNTLRNIVKKYMETNVGKGRYFFNYSDMNFKNVIVWSGLSFIDYTTKKSKFYSKEFIDLLEIYKDIKPGISPEELEKTKYALRLMAEGKIVMQPYRLTPDNLYNVNSAYKAIVNDEIEMYPVPAYKAGEKTYAKMYSGVAINQKSNNKKAAYDFIKVLISEGCQVSEYIGSPALPGIPINKQAYEVHRKNSLNAGSGVNMTIGNNMGAIEQFESISLPEQLLSKLDNIVKNITAGEIIDEEVYKIIDEEVNQYIDGKISAEQTAKAIDDKVTLFLNE